MKQTRPICLASASPRRRELLERFGLEFVVHPVHVDEREQPGEQAGEMVARLAALKAEMARHRFGGHLILAGDTAVVVEGATLGKPRNAADAKQMLARLAGRTHRVFSAYHLLEAPTGQVCHGICQTEVTFRPLSAQWIDWYGALVEPRDKAGAYAIQGLGGAMVEKIEGSYNTVLGLPIEVIWWKLLENRWVTL